MDEPIDAVLADAYETDEEREAAARMSPLDRQLRVEKMLVAYPLFDRVVRALRSRHMPVTGGRHLRGQICGLVGVSRTGKSTAIRHYRELCGNVEGREAKNLKRILYVDCKEGWRSSDLADALYRAVGFTVTPKLKVERLFEEFRAEVARHRIEMVVIDDAQWVLCARNVLTVKHAFGCIVGLAEAKVCNVLLSGTEDMRKAVEAHPHAKGRGQFPVTRIEPYSWARPADREDLSFLLQEIDDRLPFVDFSCLAEPAFLPHFFKITDGSIGPLMDYVRAAALMAIEDGSGRIETRHLIEAVDERYVSTGNYKPFEVQIDLAKEAQKEAERRRLAAADLHLNKSRKTSVLS